MKEKRLRDETEGGYGRSDPPNLENVLFRRAKMVVQLTSARQLTGPRTIGEVLLLKRKNR